MNKSSQLPNTMKNRENTQHENFQAKNSKVIARDLFQLMDIITCIKEYTFIGEQYL